jgi:hypothetical protein
MSNIDVPVAWLECPLGTAGVNDTVPDLLRFSARFVHNFPHSHRLVRSISKPMIPINILKVGDSFVQQAATDSRARDGNKTEEGETTITRQWFLLPTVCQPFILRSWRRPIRLRYCSSRNGAPEA